LVKPLRKGPWPWALLEEEKSSHKAKLRMDLVKPVVKGGHYRPERSFFSFFFLMILSGYLPTSYDEKIQ
jgi:hypothetical protein